MIQSGCLPGRKEWLLAVAVALLAVVPRAFYLAVPFERDEGAYAYMAEVIGRGGLPYVQAFDHKPPLVYYFYQVSMQLFGHTNAAPRLLAMFFVATACLLTMLLVYRFTRSLFAATCSCLLLGMGSALPVYNGFTANTEVFTLPFIVGGVLLLAEEVPSWQRFFLAGLLFGSGIMVKQPVAVIALAVLAYHVVAMVRSPGRLISRMALAGCGLVLPLALFAAFFAGHGRFAEFWEGFYTYNVRYAGDSTFAQSVSKLSNYLGNILVNDTVTWLAAAVGFVIWFRTCPNRRHTWYMACFLGGSVYATSMGGNFYPHYFVFLLPVLVVGAGLGATTLLGSSRSACVRWGLVAMVGVAFALNVRFLCMPVSDVLLISYGYQPFVKAKVVGDFLRQSGLAGRSAFIIGSEPQIYYYAGLRAVSRYYYLYPLVGDTPHHEAARRQVLDDLHRNLPDLMIFVNFPLSQGVHSADDRKRIRTLYRPFSDYQLTAMSSSEDDRLIAGRFPLENELAATEGDNAVMVFERDPGGVTLPAPLTFGSLLGI